MLSDEEKKELQELINLLYNGHISQYGKRKLEAYIKKQSKEIEELKKDRDEYKEEYIKLQNARYYNYISKDKIKAKIEELDKAYENSKNKDGESEYYYPNYTVEVLQSLLEKE